MSAFNAINPKMALLKEIRAPLTQLRNERAAIKAELRKDIRDTFIGAGIVICTLTYLATIPYFNGGKPMTKNEVVCVAASIVIGCALAFKGSGKGWTAHGVSWIDEEIGNTKNQIRAEIAERRQASRMLSLMERSGYPAP